MKARSITLRIYLAIALVVFLFTIVGYRMFSVAYLQHDRYEQTVQVQLGNVNNIFTRGTIYFSNKDGVPVPAAINKKFPTPYVIPAKIESADAEDVAGKLSAVTGLPADKILQLIRTRSDYTRLLDKHLEPAQAAEVEAIGNKGVGIAYEMDRFYPAQGVAADVLGFVGYIGNDRVGQYGIESYFNDDLAGRPAEPWSLFSTVTGPAKLLNKLFARRPEDNKEPDQPKNIILTIDKNIQAFAEETLDAALRQWEATTGSIIVQEPVTGKILAMVDRPSFNPNIYSESPQGAFLDGNVQQIFEPGSSFKPITMAAGLDLGKVTPQTTYNDTGVVENSGYTLRNFDGKAYGTMTMSQVLEKSLNIGAMFVQGQVGDDNFLNYVLNMGFGQETGIDLPGEVNGDISNLYSGRKINFLTASYGQGVAVTPLQLVTAYSAIANGGKLMRPYVVEKIVSEGGSEQVTKPEIAGIPLSEKTSAKLKAMLVSVVDIGFDKARIKGYDVAGKTGTAQIPDSHGGYLEGQYIHNFLGFAPAFNPKFTILVKIDRPQGSTFAANTLPPVFRDIAAFLLQYYNIPPTRK